MSLLSSNGTAWRAWYETHAAKLVLYARQWLPERADAEDAVQAGFVKFWRSKPQPVVDDLPLLFATVRCAALDMLKSRSRRVRREEALMPGSDDCWWDADTVAERECAEILQSALAKLTDDQREAVLLRVWGELTFADIARVLDENINTIAARYRTALAALKKNLPEECHERT